MVLRFKNFTELTHTLGLKSDVEASKGLTEYFSGARFGFSSDEFRAHYVDGSNDGGMDLVQEEDSTFYVVQTKFAKEPERTSQEAVFHELHKIGNSLAGENPNKKAEEFVNAFRRSNGDSSSLLEVIWLTTDEVTDEVAEAAQKELQDVRSKNGWGIQVDFVAFDKIAVRRMISDTQYGYVPYTGKRTLKISSKGYIENPGNGTGIKSIVCSARVVDLLQWIHKREDVKNFLQKNIREYIGENVINSELKESFAGSPGLFWYKHNGIIIFADSVSVPGDKSAVVMRNPQVVNGGQTITALYEAYDKAGRSDSDAEILVRVYRLPYEQIETYVTGIDIIKALNSQNKILASDLHSTDPQQVRLEEHFRTLGYHYHRKRSKEAKSGEYSITMKNLALRYYVCKRSLPHAGIIGQTDELFEQKNTYRDLFPEDPIERDLNSVNHIAFNYLVAWRLSELLDRLAKQLPRRDFGLSDYTSYFVLVDCYHKLMDWRAMSFKMSGWRNWKDFLHSPEFEEGLWQYSRHSYSVASSILPRTLEARQDPRKFYRTEDATTKFLPKVAAVRQFNSAMNPAYRDFERQHTE